METADNISIFGISLKPINAYVTTGLNVAQTWVFGTLNDLMTDSLVEFENHRTASDFESSLILKKAVFTFGNS